MSKLQKKKPLKDKKKRKVESEKVGTEGAALSTKAAVSPSKPVKQEKHAQEVKTGEPNIFQQGIEFLREVKIELKKVTWPTRKQTTGTTIVVIVFVFVVAAFLGLFDYSLSKLVQIVLT